MDLSRTTKYMKFMTDVVRFISPYHFEEKPQQVFSEKLYEAGFTHFHVEIRDQIFIYDDVELLKCKSKLTFDIHRFIIICIADAVRSVNPFTGRMPEKLQNDFINDYVAKVEEMDLIRFNETTFTRNVITPYKLMVAIATK